MNSKLQNQITIELIQEKHALALFDAIAENRAYLAAWLPPILGIQNTAIALNYIQACNRRINESSEFTFVLLDADKLIGRVGLYKIDSVNQSAEIGYWLTEHYQGKGIINNACRELMNFAFNELMLNRLEIRCASENAASIKVAERLNFKHEGVLRKAELLHKNFVDLHVFSCLKSEFKVLDISLIA